LAQASLSDYPFDYLLGSLHWVGDGNIFMPDYFARSEAEAYGEYFTELERMTRVGGFDIVAHLDVPIRTGFALYGNYDPANYEDLIRQVLRNCIDRGIAVEVNSGSLRRSAGVLNPGAPVLAWYREMGGERITLGSDAHHTDHVGAGLPVALEAARRAGFGHLTCFERRRARMVPID
jgi:histidinol-phosphatase (PHP family)